MTRWSTTTKHEPESINNGNKYELKDRVSIEQLNNMTENAFYAMDKASDAIKKAEEALGFAQGSGTTVFEGGNPVSQFNADKKANVSDLENYYTKDQAYSKQQIDDKLANLDVDIDFSDYYNKVQIDSLLNTKADKSELTNYVTNDALEGKGYLTSLPTNVAKTDSDNNFSTNQTIAGNIHLSKANSSINGLLNKEGSNFATTAPFIQVDNTNGAIVIGSEYVSKVKSPNIIQAQGLTDGITTKTMTEILAGGGQIILRRWSDDENGWS